MVGLYLAGIWARSTGPSSASRAHASAAKTEGVRIGSASQEVERGREDTFSTILDDAGPLFPLKTVTLSRGRIFSFVVMSTCWIYPARSSGGPWTPRAERTDRSSSGPRVPGPPVWLSLPAERACG